MKSSSCLESIVRRNTLLLGVLTTSMILVSIGVSVAEAQYYPMRQYGSGPSAQPISPETRQRLDEMCPERGDQSYLLTDEEYEKFQAELKERANRRQERAMIREEFFTTPDGRKIGLPEGAVYRDALFGIDLAARANDEQFLRNLQEKYGLSDVQVNELKKDVKKIELALNSFVDGDTALATHINAEIRKVVLESSPLRLAAGEAKLRPGSAGYANELGRLLAADQKALSRGRVSDTATRTRPVKGKGGDIKVSRKGKAPRKIAAGKAFMLFGAAAAGVATVSPPAEAGHGLAPTGCAEGDMICRRIENVQSDGQPRTGKSVHTVR